MNEQNTYSKMRNYHTTIRCQDGSEFSREFNQTVALFEKIKAPFEKMEAPFEKTVPLYFRKVPLNFATAMSFNRIACAHF